MTVKPEDDEVLQDAPDVADKEEDEEDEDEEVSVISTTMCPLNLC